MLQPAVIAQIEIGVGILAGYAVIQIILGNGDKTNQISLLVGNGIPPGEAEIIAAVNPVAFKIQFTGKQIPRRFSF